MKNLTYDQLIELAPKDRPFQIEIEMLSGITSGKRKLWAVIYNGNLDTCFEANSFHFWQIGYKGTFTLIDPRYQKPEVLKVGQKVKIMESARECKDYKEWDDNKKDLINTIQTINYIIDNCNGISYGISYGISCYYEYPHYCVMPVEEEEVQEIPELENTLEQLDNLVAKAQDIISKYKK